MSIQQILRRCGSCLRTIAAGLAVLQMSFGQTFSPEAQQPRTRTPIKHVIIIVGENRTFDHLFATYKPKPGERVDNLLSKGIIREDGTPGPNYSLAAQYSARDYASDGYQINPQDKSLYGTLPAPLTGGPSDVCKDNGICTLEQARQSENGLAPEYYKYLLTGGTGQKSHVPDQRIKDVNDLPPGPFQLTSDTFSYDAYAASPVHRFFQMWQQADCDIAYATIWNPSGCRADLFPWVETTVGAGANGLGRPAIFTDRTTREGSAAMSFYNMLEGDVPYFKYLADNYAISDNYHQPVMGGTGANSLMLGFGDAIYFSDANGHPASPPHNQPAAGYTGIVDEVENPNAQPGTNNWYLEDGYGSSNSKGYIGGGSYVNCSDSDAPGVGSVLNYLSLLPYRVDPKCDPNRYYLVNNYNPGYFGDGSNAYLDHNKNNTPFTIPPTKQRSIGDVLNERRISWAYYGDQYNQYLSDKYQQNYGAVGSKSDQYCNICNPFQYQTSIMADPAVRKEHIRDTVDLYKAIHDGTLPAVSYVKPSGWVDGHPASSKFNLYEGYVKKIVDEVRANPKLWDSTAIFVTVDEGGGYYDSGYIQPLDFFGDGTRIPLIVVSKFTKPGHIGHEYSDHVSILKFIEHNWNLPTITDRSRDNLPNPETAYGNPYVPVNAPAIGDLFDLFNFNVR